MERMAGVKVPGMRIGQGEIRRGCWMGGARCLVGLNWDMLVNVGGGLGAVGLDSVESCR